MQFKSKTVPLLILALTAVVVSGAVFAFFRDQEGPNLVVVMGLAAILYLPCVAFYLSSAIRTSLRRLVGTIVVQVLIAAGVYLALR
jgi:hypothetical protein